MDPLRWAVSHWSKIAWQWSVRMERNGSPIVGGQWNWPCCGCNYSRLFRLDHFWSWLWNFGGCGFLREVWMKSSKCSNNIRFLVFYHVVTWFFDILSLLRGCGYKHDWRHQFGTVQLCANRRRMFQPGLLHFGAWWQTQMLSESRQESKPGGHDSQVSCVILLMTEILTWWFARAETYIQY